MRNKAIIDEKKGKEFLWNSPLSESKPTTKEEFYFIIHIKKAENINPATINIIIKIYGGNSIRLVLVIFNIIPAVIGIIMASITGRLALNANRIIRRPKKRNKANISPLPNTLYKRLAIKSNTAKLILISNPPNESKYGHSQHKEIRYSYHKTDKDRHTEIKE